MEICIMDPSSQFNFGRNSQRTIDPSYNYNEIDENCASSSGNYPKRQCQEYQSSQSNAFRWRSDGVDCKREADPMNSMLGSNMQEGGNYDSENEFNEQYAYDYDQTPPSYAAHRPGAIFRPSQPLHQPRMGPYQLSSSNSQLPSWYNPPMPTESFFPQHPGAYQQQHQYAYQQSMGSPSADPNMRNMIHLSSRNGREARNRAEKHRRDKLNGSIQELSTMVPHVAESPRRVDKTAVLRFSAHGLRIDYVFGNQSPNRYLINPKSTEGLMKLLDTFLLTVTCRGNVVLVSSSIEQYLGHCRSDLYGQSLLNITHPEDHAFLKQQLIPTDLHNLFLAKTDENGEVRQRTQEEEDEIDRKLREDRRDFNIRLARAGPRSEPTIYEVVRIDGCFRRADAAPRGKPQTGPTGLQLIRRARGRDDNVPLHSVSGNDIILIAMARIVKPPMFCDRLIEACRYEYKTRHLIDGRIVQCDQRISIVAGYMTEEISGLSPFTFIHRDDVRWVMVALRQMYDFGRNYGESCYRLMSRTGQFIYLKTRGCLEVDDKTREVHSFVCVNSLVSDEEGRRLIREMKKKFSAIISEDELSAMETDVPAVENPQNLERAILNLITNLNNPATYDDDNVSMISDSTTENEDLRRNKTPPLAIIAPKSNTIKTSIFKAVGVLSHTKGKSPTTIKDEPKSPEAIGQPTSDSGKHLSIKTEDVFSPASTSLSSVESEMSSPMLSHTSNTLRDVEGTGHRRTANILPNNRETNEFYTPYEDLPAYALESQSSVSPSPSVIASNNNNSNVNRNSVLKRPYSSTIEGYSELAKKRALSHNSTSDVQMPSQLDLLDATDEDVSDILSSAFPDDDVDDRFEFESSLSEQQDNGLQADEQEEQRAILQSLRETVSVIKSNPRSSPNRRQCNEDGR